MSVLSDHINELKASEAFSKQSKIFDSLYGSDAIIDYKRKRVRDHVIRNFRPGDTILELNCGTGEDALFFAQKNFSVHATDISGEMLGVLNKKVKGLPFATNISTEQCSFTELDLLQDKGPFDHVFSNFGGLNCTSELNKVLYSLNSLVKPGGTVNLVIISKFCLWEFLLLFKGKFKTAFRRFFSKKGRKACVEGKLFTCWYYSPSYVIDNIGKNFDLVGLEGLCTIVPPSYIENFAEKHPKTFSLLAKKEEQLKTKWPWKFIGDYFIISLRKKTVQ